MIYTPMAGMGKVGIWVYHWEKSWDRVSNSLIDDHSHGPWMGRLLVAILRIKTYFISVCVDPLLEHGTGTGTGSLDLVDPYTYTSTHTNVKLAPTKRVRAKIGQRREEVGLSQPQK